MRKRTNYGGISQASIREMLERQNFRCALTGKPLTPETAEVDHILPVSRGGTHTIDNLQILHKSINRSKSTLDNEEFISMCREALAWREKKRKKRAKKKKKR